MNKFVSSLLSLLFLFFTSSCDYQFSEEHYVEIEKPSDNISIKVYLNDVGEDQLIYIYKPTDLYFQIDAEKLPLLSVNFKIDGSSLGYSVGNEGSFVNIHPALYDGSEHELTLDIEIKSNSGSLADKMLLERYTGHLSFKIKYMPTPDININLRQEKTQDKHLKLIWNQPVVKGAEVDHYAINTGYGPTIEIDPDHHFFVDENYLYGYKRYTFEVHFKNRKLYPLIYYYTVEYNPIILSDFIYEDIDALKMRVSWPENDFACKYAFKTAKNIIIQSSENSVMIDCPPFPYEYTPSYLYILAEDVSFVNSAVLDNYPSIYSHYEAPRVGNGFAPLIYSLDKKTSLGIDADYRNAKFYASFFDLETMKKIKTVEITDFYASGTVVCSPVTGKIVFSGLSFHGFYIYNDDTFTNPKYIDEPVDWGWSYKGLTITDNDRLCVAVPTTNEFMNAKIYNATSGKLLYTIPLDYFTNTGVHFSQDGKYLCFDTAKELKVYQLNDTDAQLLYTKDIDSQYNMILTNPANINELIFSGYTNFALMDIPTGNIRKTIPGWYISIDPFTGNIARLENGFSTYLDILNPDASATLYRIKVDGQWFDLLNNYLLYDDYYTPISTYINK